MKQRVYDRLAAGVSVLLLAALAVATYYLAQTAIHPGGDSSARRKLHEPDYFVEDFQLTRLNPRGEPVFKLTATRLNHYPDDDTLDFLKPVLVSLDTTKPLVTIRSDRGRATPGGVETHLYDNVVLTRAGAGKSLPMKVESDYLLLLTEQDIARTDKPVRITYGESVLDGVGMEFNNDTRQIELYSQVRGRWTSPPPRPKN
ncbi:MAG: LPS export ABC transporter periplasmic protein LptC [Burkholderiaceae bacterium]